jgi:signal transduction histidine kinase
MRSGTAEAVVPERPTILIVEDERIVAEDLRQTLEELDYAVIAVVASADAALRIASERRPNLVLMDIRIEGTMDGIDAAALLRERFDVPVVYLTAYASDATLARAKLTEPLGYLIKPVRTAELRSTLEMALYRSQREVTAREHQRARNEWTLIVAHDLRQPIHTISVSAQLLLQREHGAGVRRAAMVMAKGADRLDRMVNDLLSTSRIETRRLELQRRPTDLAALLQQKLEGIRTGMSTTVHLELLGELPLLNLDPDRIEQVVDNLVSNAVKYGYPGRDVTVTVNRRDAAVELAVSNWGEGIAAEELPTLFDRFKRGPAGRSAGSRSGLGLGLFITRGLVEAHGGTIHVSSTPRGLTVFRVLLPIEETIGG